MWNEIGTSSKRGLLSGHGERRPVRSDRAYLKVPSSDSIYDRTYHRNSLSSSASSSPLLPGQNVRSLTTLQQVNPNSGNYQTLYNDDNATSVSRFRSASPLPSFKPQAFVSGSTLRNSSLRHSNYQNEEDVSPTGMGDSFEDEMDCLVRHSDIDLPPTDHLDHEDQNTHIRKLSIRRAHQDKDNLGFTIKAGGGRGSRQGGIYAHRVEKGSAADKAGLRRGDQILAANHVSFIDVSLDEALEVLNSNKTIHLTVLPPSPFQHLPLTATQSSSAANEISSGRHYWLERSERRPTSPINNKYSHQDHVQGGLDRGEMHYGSNVTSPIDSNTRDSLIHSPTSHDDLGTVFSRHSSRKKSKKANDLPTSSSTTRDASVRLLSFEVHQGECFGLTIKGGSEYGLGIFISAIERHSVAEKVGLQVGDQILSVNDVDFVAIRHQEAAQMLQHSPSMRVAIRRLGKVPQCFSEKSVASASSLTPKNLSPTNNPLTNSNNQFDNYLETNSNRLSRRNGSRKKLCSGEKGLDQVVPQSSEESTEATLLAERRVDAKAAQLLSQGELLTLSYYHNEYETKSMTIDAFVAVLLELLETPQKYTLMTEVRNLIRQEDLDKFDELIYRREVQAMKSKEAVKYVSDEMTDKTVSPSKSPRSSMRKYRHGDSHFHGQRDDNREFLMLGERNDLNTPSEDSGVDLANGMASRNGQTGLGYASTGSKLSVSSRSEWKNEGGGQARNWEQQGPSYSGPRHSFDLRCTTGPRVMSAAEKRLTQLRRHSSGGEGGNHDDKRQNYGNAGGNNVSWGSSVEDRRWSIGSEVPVSDYPNNGEDQVSQGRQDLPTVTFDEHVHTREESPFTVAPLPVPIAVPSLMPPSLILSNEKGVSNVVPDMAPQGHHPDSTMAPNCNESLTEESNSLDNADNRSDDPWLQIPSPTHPLVRRHRSLPDPHAIGSPRGSGGVRKSALDPSTYMSSASQSMSLQPPDNRHLAQQQQQLRSASLRNPGHRTVPEGSNIRVTIKKSRPILGIAIEGGANTTQPLPRIISIHASGAAFEAGGLKVGHIILEVDGIKMQRKRHEDAAKFIADSFYGGDRDEVEFLVTEKAKTLLDLRRSSCLLMD